MKVLVACESSGTVRDAFLRKGHDAMSCDLLATRSPGPHYKGDVFSLDLGEFDLIIAHPPCTYLCVSGARWLDDDRYPNRRDDREKAAEFFMKLFNSEAPKVACENPVGYMSTYFRKPDQYIHPYHFGDPVSKKTGLWLKGLPALAHSNVVQPSRSKTKSGVEYDSWWLGTSKLPYKERMEARSKTFEGIANAMADQWG